MESWRGCPLFPREGWEDRSSNSLNGVNRLDEVTEGAALKIRLGVHEGTKTVWFPDWLDPWEVQVDGIRTRWGTTPPGLHYKAQLFEVNPQTDRMASGGVLKTRTIYELESKTDEDVEIGRQDWPINDTTGVPQEILDEIENRKEEREEQEEEGDDGGRRGHDFSRGHGGYGGNDGNGGRGVDPRFAPPPQGNPFAPGNPTIPHTNPFAGTIPQHPQNQVFQPGMPGMPGMNGMPGSVPTMGGMPGMPGVPGINGASPYMGAQGQSGMPGAQTPPPPGYEWSWHPFPQGGGTFVLRETPKPPPPPPPPVESFEDKVAKWIAIGGALVTVTKPLIDGLKPVPAPPAPPPPPSPMESLASRLLERQLSAPAQAPAPAVDAKAIEANLRLEYELRALREDTKRLKEARAEPKGPASETFLKQLEQAKELAEKIGMTGARDEAQGTLSMLVDLADTEGGKEVLGKIGDGLARWLNSQPPPAPTSPTSFVVAPPPQQPQLQAPAASPAAAQGPAMDPDGYMLCLQCGTTFQGGTEDATAHAGHTVARLTAPEVHQ